MTRAKSHHAPPKPPPQFIVGWGLPMDWAGTPPRHPWDEDRVRTRICGPYRQQARRDRDE